MLIGVTVQHSHVRPVPGGASAPQREFAWRCAYIKMYPGGGRGRGVMITLRIDEMLQPRSSQVRHVGV